MLSLARVAVAVTLSAVAVAALTWAGWPRPRSVLPFDAAEEFVFADQPGEDAPPYRVIRYPYGTVGPAAFWFLSPEGNLFGPWRAGRCGHSLGFDDRGRFLASTPPPGSQIERSSGGGYELGRYDPATGRAETLVTLAADGVDGVGGVRLSGDLTTLAALVGTDPLAFDICDVADGRKPTRFTLPGRAGGVQSRKPVVATLAWGVSHDGRELALGEAWDGATRVGPPGIEVYDIGTGKLARRLPQLVLPARFPGGPADQPGDVGVGSFAFTADGRGVTATLVRRFELTPDFPRWWKTSFGPDSPECDFATGEQRWPAVPQLDPTVTGVVATHGGHFLSVCRSPTLYRVTDADGTPVGADWQSLPGRFAGSEYLATQPHTGSAVVHRDTQTVAEPPGWMLWLTRQKARPAGAPAQTRCHYLYHDWLTGEFRPMPGTGGGGPQSHAVGPYGLAILTPSPAGGTLEFWDLPPRSAPWPWSVPGGVAIGVLLMTVGVRVRRRLATPGEPGA